MSASKGSHSANDTPNRGKQYIALGVVVAILVAALLIWHSGIFQKNATAATVGEQKVTVAEMDYYYNSVANNFINNAYAYAQYGIDSGYNVELSPEEQYYSADTKTTYAQHFMDSALEQLQRVTILNDQAKEAGYSLSDEGKDQVRAALNQLTMYSVQTGYSKDAYLRLLYGEHMSQSLYENLVEQAVLAEEFATWKADQFTYTDEELTTYYDENKDNLDTYDYRYAYIYGETEPTLDEEGNEVEPTEEQTAAAKAEAQRKATQMEGRVRGGEAFNTVAQDYVAEETAANYAADEDYSHNTDTMGSALSTVFADWLKDGARAQGEVTVLEADNNGYCVVQFLGRAQRNDLYETVDLRSILVNAETTPTEVATDETDPNTGEPVMETVDRANEEQIATAKTKADELLAQFTTGSGADAFGELAKANSDDNDTKDKGGVMTAVTRSELSSAASAWAFSPDLEVGATTIVEVTDSEGNVTGYQILFLEGVGLPRWEYAAKAALSSEDYDAWYDAFLEQYPTAYVGDPLEDRVATGEDADGEDGSDDSDPADDADPTDDTDNGDTTDPAEGDNGTDAGDSDNGGEDTDPADNTDAPTDGEDDTTPNEGE